MQADGLAVVVEGRALSVPWAQVGWLVLGPAAGRAPAGKPAHLLELADGTSLRAASLALEDGRLSAQDGPASYSVEPARLARIRVAPVAYVYLSDGSGAHQADALPGRVLAAARRPGRRGRAAGAEGARLPQGHRHVRRHADDVRPAGRLLEALRASRGGRMRRASWAA